MKTIFSKHIKDLPEEQIQAPLEKKRSPNEPKDFEINVLWGLLKYKGRYCVQAIIILVIVAALIVIILKGR
jgi:hypothetical protein